MEEIKSMLEELVLSQAFEIQKRPDMDDQYDVPYMLNDALECYLVFTEATMQGNYIDELEEELAIEFVETSVRKCLIIRQGNKNTCTLWFGNAYKELSLYRFHEIGHFWEKEAEQWRRLVYMIGTMEDKYLFMGEEVCNEQELRLIPLMQFAPFYRYYPAKICIPEEYVVTEEGCRCMLELAELSGDWMYQSVIRLYMRFPCQFLEDILHRMLMYIGRGKLYDLIFDRTVEAAGAYPERDYGEVNNRIRERERQRLKELFEQSGYQGNYPDFYQGKRHIQVTEEHPFTRMESFERGFGFQLMVSEQPKGLCGKNRGFFKGRGLHGWISKPDTFF